MQPPNKVSKKTIDAILEQIYNGEIPERFEEVMKNKNKPENLSYEEELLLKHSLPVAFFLYVLNKTGMALKISLKVIIIFCIAGFWWVYIPHLFNTLMFQILPHLYIEGDVLDAKFGGFAILWMAFWGTKDFCLFLLYENLVENLEKVKKIKEQNKELFDND